MQSIQQVETKNAFARRRFLRDKASLKSQNPAEKKEKSAADGHTHGKSEEPRQQHAAQRIAIEVFNAFAGNHSAGNTR